MGCFLLIAPNISTNIHRAEDGPLHVLSRPCLLWALHIMSLDVPPSTPCCDMYCYQVPMHKRTVLPQYTGQKLVDPYYGLNGALFQCSGSGSASGSASFWEPGSGSASGWQAGSGSASNKNQDPDPHHSEKSDPDLLMRIRNAVSQYQLLQKIIERSIKIPRRLIQKYLQQITDKKLVIKCVLSQISRNLRNIKN